MIGPYLKILKKRSFSLLWLGQIVSQFGDRLTQMALIGFVYRIAPHSSLSLAKIMSLAIIPVFILSPVAGVYIDRWNKQRVMWVSDFLRGVFILTIPFLLGLTSLLFIYVFIFLSFCVGRFFIPAKMAIVPSLVEKKEVFMANSLISTTAMISAILGFGLGGVIVERLGIRSAFIIDATTFFASAFFISLMRIKEKSWFRPQDIIELSKKAITEVKNSFIFDIKQGVKYLWKEQETKFAVRTFFVLFSCVGALYVVFIVFIQDTLSSATLELGKLAVGAGVGLFLGSLLYGRVAHRFSVKRVINIAMFLASGYLIFFVTLLRVTPSKNFAFFSCFLLGLFAAPIIIAVNGLIHTKSEDEFWGRTFSSLEVVIHFAFLIFMFISSYLAEIFSPFTIILFVGIIIFSFSLVSLGGKGND